MPYFDHESKPEQRHHRTFYQPVVDDDGLDDAYEDDDQPDDDVAYDMELDEDTMDEEERRLARRDRWRVLAGVGDFLSIIAGMVVILTLIMLLISLINWVYADLSQSFVLWQTRM
ncbi:MAG: hypothetical protein ACI4MJ_12405 [Aristaeellaceae bacterium]